MNRSLKIPYVARAILVLKGENWTWNLRFKRGLGSVPTGGNFLSLDYCPQTKFGAR